MKILTFHEWRSNHRPNITDDVINDLSKHDIDSGNEIKAILMQEYNQYLLKNNSMKIRTFDIDGVTFINPEIGGLRPDPDDVIITGRSYEEREETETMLAKRGIQNKVMFNPLPFNEKTRETAGLHKANCIKALFSSGYKVTAHFEDDDVQANVIRLECPEVPVIMIVHDLTEKENVRHYEF
jgi:hypothetical protein